MGDSHEPAAYAGIVASHPSYVPTHDRRRTFWTSCSPAYDVIVIGAGIQGACIYHHLVQSGYRVLIVDRSDFAAATSQASAMLIWGGLLYLRDGAIREVWRLCRSRQRMLDELSAWIHPQRFRYVLGQPAHRSTTTIQCGLWLYWLLAGGRPTRPRKQDRFQEQAFLRNGRNTTSFAFDEAALRQSDARFILHWINQWHDTDSQAVNYCEVIGGCFDHSQSEWRLELKDTFGDGEQVVRSRAVINAAGVWSDVVNSIFGINAPYRHVLSKGASITIDRPDQHEDVLIFDSCSRDEGLSLRPWGPVSLWGSTETAASSMEQAFKFDPDDVSYLLHRLNQYAARPVSPEDIVGLRCGARPLAVARDADAADPLTLSRHCQLHQDPSRAWLTVYGGKITGCMNTAAQATRRVSRMIGAGLPDRSPVATEPPQPPTTRFPGLDEPVPDATWCRNEEQCLTLDDYLRRRTNIAQWVPRGGLGRHDEQLPELLRIAKVFCSDDEEAAHHTTQQYCRKVREQFDAVIAAVDGERSAANRR